MPCYDDRGEVERDAAARAGCEMAKVLGDHPELMAELTLITRRWILAHQEFDRKKAWGGIPYLPSNSKPKRRKK